MSGAGEGAAGADAGGPSDVVCVGSTNMDMIVYVPRMPAKGETIHGHGFQTCHGGKGANQAVQAALLGAKTAMVSKVGTDDFGRAARANYADNGIDASCVFDAPDGVSTGVATITVDDAGSNNIVVIAGANAKLTGADVEAAAGVISGSRVLVCQMEVPTEALEAAMRIAKAAGVVTIYNPAPAGGIEAADLDRLLPHADIVCPNETETELLTKLPVTNPAERAAAAKALRDRGASNVLLTLGEHGQLWVPADGGEATHVPLAGDAGGREAVDTSGAGDSFLGAFAAFLCMDADRKGGSGPGSKVDLSKVDVLECIRRAGRVASESVMSKGTQPSYRRRDALPADLFA